MNFSEHLKKVAEEYEQNRLDAFTKNELARFVRQDCVASVLSIVGDTFKTKASAGQSVWADVPWIGIFHPLETTTAQYGFYVVYLFNPARQTVSLSMNQGVVSAKNEAGGTKKGRELLKTRAALLLKRTGTLPKVFSTEPIDLGGTNGLPRDYEAGHVFGRTYDLQALENDQIVKQDLAKILELYKNLVTENGYTIPDDSDGEEFPTVIEKKKISLHKRFDRFGGANNKVKSLKGYICEACNFDFEKSYGPELGKKFIEAHHLKPFSDLEEGMIRTLDLERDFAVLCSNCHRMIHRQSDPSDLALLIETLEKYARND